jgi:hypothetical protein
VLTTAARGRCTDRKTFFIEQRFLGDRYAAWVIPATGKRDVKVVDLGEAGPIDEAVKEVRKSLVDTAHRIKTDGEEAGEKALRQPLERLARRILAPLRESLASTGEWIISPDGALWLVPWGILPLEDGSYAVEKHRIRYIVTGRDLVRQRAAAAERHASTPKGRLYPFGAKALEIESADFDERRFNRNRPS